MIAMFLEKNRCVSSSSRTKHIEIKYFFIQDRIEKGDIGLEYCHTDNMVAYFMTKPIQGKKYLNSETASWECQKPQEGKIMPEGEK